jgi:dUTP pyrophosphatase
MNTVRLKVKPLEHFQGLEIPRYQTSGSVGMDVRACLKQDSLVIRPGERVAIPTGLAVSIPEGYELQVRPRSGLSLRSNLLMVNSPGTIDVDFTGETHVIMGNFGPENIQIHHGDRIAQWILSPVVRAELQVVSDLTETDRGAKGFGSTGMK